MTSPSDGTGQVDPARSTNTADRERFRRVDQLFEAALALPANERAAFLEALPEDDAWLAGDVRRLLDAQLRAADFLEAPLREVVPDLLVAPPESVAPDHAGAFRIVREIGRGGMGVVYLAERDDAHLRQRVALKLIRHAESGEAGVRRFIEERRILALLEHPGIARLIDGGVTDDGLPWFAMELVGGKPIDVYSDARCLTIDERIARFVAICEAVQYAHEHFVIHRDLKPGNILVGDNGELKLLDFGIAKLLDPLRADDGPETRTGVLALTPEYAAPEQVQGGPVSPATDVYALGVLLYTLLTGQRPYEVRGRSPADVERIICEIDPQRPSATFDEHHDHNDRVARASARGAKPDRLSRRLAGDLDTIILKALRKEPRERYTSAEALAADLKRHQSGHPVLARPQTAGYRIRRYVKRNRWAVAALGAFMLLLTTYAITVTIERAQVRQSLEEARVGTRRAEQVTDYMLGLFKASEGGRLFTDTLRAREQLERGVAQARALSGQPELRAQMLDVIGRIETYLGERERAKPLLREALAIRRSLRGEQHADVATSLESLAEATDRDVAATLELRREAIALRRRLADPDDPKTTNAIFEFAQALHRAGDVTGAKPLINEWMAAVARQPREVSPERASQLTFVGLFMEYGGRLDRAEPMLREALAINRALYGEHHHDVASSLKDLGGLLDRERRWEEAESVLREAVQIHRTAYPQGHPDLASALRLWGIMLERLQRFQDAQPPLREAVAMRRRFFGSDAVDVAAAELDLSFTLVSSGSYDEAALLARDATSIYRRQLGVATPLVYNAQAYLADALRGQGRFAESEALLLATYAKFEKPTPVTRAWRDHALAALVRLYDAKGNSAEAARYRALKDATVP